MKHCPQCVCENVLQRENQNNITKIKTNQNYNNKKQTKESKVQKFQTLRDS